MEDINVKLKPKKKNFLDKIKELFEDKSKRGLYVILFILPFVIIIGIFGFVAFKEAKNLIDLVQGSNEVSDTYKVESKGYILRDNATEYQQELFAELKNAIEVNGADEQTIASLVCKNYVADFYTWTNKQGQYDIGGMGYIYDGEFEDGTHFKENVYAKARDGFYKQLNNYMKEYGASDLLEVQDVQITNCSKTNIILNEHVANKQDENGEWYDYREDHSYDAFNITCTWAYKETKKFDTSKYATKMNFVVLSDGSIIAADEKEIDIKNPIVNVENEEVDESIEEE